MKGITSKELSILLQSNADIQLIDVRETHEHDDFNIGGTLIPLDEITRHLDDLEKEKPVILYCRVGMRSQIAIQRLLEKYPFKNLVNLVGGIEAWKKQV